jgi:hypothetical protein
MPTPPWPMSVGLLSACRDQHLVDAGVAGLGCFHPDDDLIAGERTRGQLHHLRQPGTVLDESLEPPPALRVREDGGRGTLLRGERAPAHQCGAAANRGGTGRPQSPTTRNAR